MESKPSSGPETPAPLLTEPAAPDRPWVRSRRVQTFALGALVGALALSLVVVVTSIFAAAQNDGRYPVQPASDVVPTTRAPTPAPAPLSTPVPTPIATVPTDEEQADTAPGTGDGTQPSVEPSPAPAETESPPAEEDETASGPGKSGSAPGQTKKPQSP